MDLKYELIYPGDFARGAELFQALDHYFHFYKYASFRLEVRKRSARLQILQSSVDGMLQVIAGRAFEHAGHPGGASGLLVKDYRGKNAEREIWRFDAALMAQLHGTLKQVAIEEGQWTEKRDLTGSISIATGNALLTAGRDRLAAEKKAALERGEEWN